ncbi:TIGR02757 family protein [Leptospira adleri]|uniref:TIGR02757 family protein n=1 Tax=Leptospira adleri TaxID=2023186 RepID=A0A2M9YRH4_9LEPT|nr:TIGR02757 family protein [Leptospira adleri]PJZ54134.1 TIGR02757 family protein [Leptospira adleri]PJZ62686.1 TIGR02757 family protein [Leptospira adleri]
MNQNTADQKLKRTLEKIFEKYESPEFLSSDPIEFPHSYSNPNDQEISGFISALFSYGNVRAIKNYLGHLFEFCGNSPHEFFLKEDLSRIRKEIKPYRFQKSADILLFFRTIQEHLQNDPAQSLESLFSLSREKEFNLAPREQKLFLQGGSLRQRILSFQIRFRAISKKMDSKGVNSYGYRFLVGQGIHTSSIKRYSMYLRWMVRKDFPDFGIYTSVAPEELLYPLDIHIQRVASVLEISSRKTPDWKKAEEITAFFRRIFPEDPTRGDFALSRLGILRRCKSKYMTELCEECQINTICSVYKTRTLKNRNR